MRNWVERVTAQHEERLTLCCDVFCLHKMMSFTASAYRPTTSQLEQSFVSHTIAGFLGGTLFSDGMICRDATGDGPLSIEVIDGSVSGGADANGSTPDGDFGGTFCCGELEGEHSAMEWSESGSKHAGEESQRSSGTSLGSGSSSRVSDTEDSYGGSTRSLKQLIGVAEKRVLRNCRKDRRESDAAYASAKKKPKLPMKKKRNIFTSVRKTARAKK